MGSQAVEPVPSGANVGRNRSLSGDDDDDGGGDLCHQPYRPTTVSLLHSGER